MKTRFPVHAAIAVAIAAALSGAAIAAPAVTTTKQASMPVNAKAGDQECQATSRRRGRDADAAETAEIYPNATRTSPNNSVSQRFGTQINRINSAYQDDDYEQVLTRVDALLAEERASDYDKAYAARLAANAALSSDNDYQAALQYIDQAIASDALDNDSHFQLLLMKAQIQAQEGQLDESLVTFEQYFEGSRSERPDDIGFRGQVLLQAERYDEAIVALQAAIAAAETPSPNWVQALLGAYVETERTEEAAALAESIAAAAPDDKRSQINLAILYIQTDQVDQAIAVYERLRSTGQLTEETEYRNLYALYLNADGKEQEAIDVINEGLANGVLKQEYRNYAALAQAYYFSDQLEPAIEAYRQAAPLAADGEGYLNLAKVLYNEGRTAETREAAEQALSRGVRNPEEAQRLIER